MIAQVASADALSVIGFFLTLVGLLGSFFYIHLGEWLREVIALETKWDINRKGDEDYQKAGRFECRYEIDHIATGITKLTSAVITGFVMFIFVLGLLTWVAQPGKDAAWTYIGVAGLGFIIIYLSMTYYLLKNGLRKESKLRSDLDEYYKTHTV
jgi:hypothetical protein